MPPFNFGQTFNQSLQSSLNRAQQRRAQKASRQLRLRRLRQQAEQARKDRQMQRTQFAERQDNVERRLDMQKEQQEFNREQQVAQSMQQMYQNAQQSRFRDRQLDLQRDRLEAQTGKDGIMVSNDDFEGMNPLPEGQTTPLQSLGRAGRQAYWQGQMKRRGGEQVQSLLSGDQQSPLAQRNTLEDLQAPSIVPESVQDATSAAATYLNPANYLYEGLNENRASQFQIFVNKATGRVQMLQSGLAGEKQKPLATQTVSDLTKLDQTLAGYDDTERVRDLRKRIQGLRAVASQFSGQNNPMQQARGQSIQRLVQVIRDPDASTEEVIDATEQLRKYQQGTQ